MFSPTSPVRIKNDRSSQIRVTIDEDEYVVPSQSWLMSGDGDHLYLWFSGDAPMRAVPIRRAPRSDGGDTAPCR